MIPELKVELIIDSVLAWDAAMETGMALMPEE